MFGIKFRTITHTQYLKSSFFGKHTHTVQRENLRKIVSNPFFLFILSVSLQAGEETEVKTVHIFLITYINIKYSNHQFNEILFEFFLIISLIHHAWSGWNFLANNTPFDRALISSVHVSLPHT